MRNGNIPEFYRAHYSISWIAFTNCERKDQSNQMGSVCERMNTVSHDQVDPRDTTEAVEIDCKLFNRP